MNQNELNKLKLMLQSRMDFIKSGIIAIIALTNEPFEEEMAIIDNVFKIILKKAEKKEIIMYEEE